MIEERYYQRHWAETVRLYSGLLPDNERRPFIEEIAEKDILLATECRSTIFNDDQDLDRHLASIAIRVSRNFTKPAVSAQGLLALVELDEFDEVAVFFRVAGKVRRNGLYYDIISNLIRRASPVQIFELLKVLAQSNQILLSKTLDILLDQSHFFNGEAAKGLQLLSALQDSKKSLLQKKIICLFEIRSEIHNPTEFLYCFLEDRLLKFADKLNKLVKMEVDEKILSYLEKFIESKESSWSIRILREIIFRANAPFDKSEVNVIISRSLNPIIKQLSLLTHNEGQPISDEVAIRICQTNIEIGNRSSIEFAIDLIDRYKLGKYISKERLVVALLTVPSYQRIELAYKIVRDYKLSDTFTYEGLCALCIGDCNYQSLELARRIVIEQFEKEDQLEKLTQIAFLSLKDGVLRRLPKQILFGDHVKILYNNEFTTGVGYRGFVAGTYKRHYQIFFSTHHLALLYPFGKVKVRVNSFIDFEFLKLEEKIENSEIRVVRESVEDRKYWYSDFYLGQIINFRVDDTGKSFAKMNIPNKNLRMVVSIDQIKDSFIRNIDDHLPRQSVHRAVVVSFDKKSRIVFCSIRQLQKIGPQINEDTSVKDKLNDLVQKYSRK